MTKLRPVPMLFRVGPKVGDDEGWAHERLALDDFFILYGARPALRRKHGGWFVQAKLRHAQPAFQPQRVRRLVDAGLLRWVNHCQTAAALTEAGARCVPK